MNALLQTLNARAPDILRALGLMEVQIAILTLLVLAIERWMRPLLPKILYALWLVVLAKCLLPPLLLIPPPAFIPAGFNSIFPTMISYGTAATPLPSAAAIVLTAWPRLRCR